jgi:hypothetical protein
MAIIELKELRSLLRGYKDWEAVGLQQPDKVIGIELEKGKRQPKAALR